MSYVIFFEYSSCADIQIPPEVVCVQIFFEPFLYGKLIPVKHGVYTPDVVAQLASWADYSAINFG